MKNIVSFLCSDEDVKKILKALKKYKTYNLKVDRNESLSEFRERILKDKITPK